MGPPPELATLDLGGAVVDEVLRSSDKSLLATGHHGDQPVIVKVLRDHDDFWAAKFAHEIRLYRAFSEHPPPVRVPELVHAAASVLVVERVPGTVVDTDRYPEHPLDAATVDGVLAAVTEFARWAPPEGVLAPVFDLPDRIERYHQQGWFTDADRDALHALLQQLPAPATPAHGDPLPANLLRTDNGTVALLDFEFTGLFLPGFDLAMLHTLLAATPGAQQRIENLVAEQGIQDAFVLNQAMVLSRELRLHTELPDGELRKQRLQLLRPRWERARQRLHTGR